MVDEMKNQTVRIEQMENRVMREKLMRSNDDEEDDKQNERRMKKRAPEDEGREKKSRLD